MSNIVQSSRRRSTTHFIAPPKPKIPVEIDGDHAEDTEEDDDDNGDEDDDDNGEDEDSQSEEFNEGKLIRTILKVLFIIVVVHQKLSNGNGLKG